jgi:hypothetical protein
MRLFWIIIGILALMWLGFLHFDRKEIRLDLDRQEQRMENVENHVRDEENGNLNVGDEMQDETNDAQEEVKQGIPTKEEQLRDEKQDKEEELKEEQKENGTLPNDKVPQNEKKDVETTLPKDASSFLGQESIVAFNSNYQESKIAFKQLDTPKLGHEAIDAKDAYLIIDPMLFSLK